jgi:serine/threonine protein kinase
MQIGDFGLSKLTTTQFAETIVGTPFYMAPEIHQGKPYSFSSDVWSLGIIVYYMCTYTMPFNANTQIELEEKVQVPLGPSLNPNRPFMGPLVILLGPWLGAFSPSFVGGPALTTTMMLMGSKAFI